MAESFFGTLKNEWLNRMTFTTRAEARQAVVKYVEGFYNQRRLHSGLDYKTVLVVECKHWGRTVPQGEVHKFRTTLTDAGVNVGFLVSSAGFQPGAHDAALYSNVRLTDWKEFQSMFAERWYQNFMLDMIRKEARRLIDCAREGSFGFMTEVFLLPKEKHAPVMELARQHANIARFTSSLLWFKGAIAHNEPRMLRLPLRSAYKTQLKRWSPLPDDVLDAPALRPLLTALVNHFRQATSDFDAAMWQ